MDEVREQAERDYQLASGLSQDVETDDNVFRQTTARLPWLLIGMIGGIGNSMILGNFDSTFAAHPEMALHPPYRRNRGNVGTQSLALIVQGLANSSLDAQNTWKQIVKESVVAVINATIISMLVYIYNFIRFKAKCHRDLFGFIQPVCSSHVRFHLWDPGSYDTGKTKNRSAIALQVRSYPSPMTL